MRPRARGIHGDLFLLFIKFLFDSSSHQTLCNDSFISPFIRPDFSYPEFGMLGMRGGCRRMPRLSPGAFSPPTSLANSQGATWGPGGCSRMILSSLASREGISPLRRCLISHLNSMSAPSRPNFGLYPHKKVWAKKSSLFLFVHDYFYLFISFFFSI